MGEVELPKLPTCQDGVHVAAVIWESSRERISRISASRAKAELASMCSNSSAALSKMRAHLSEARAMHVHMHLKGFSGSFAR